MECKIFDINERMKFSEEEKAMLKRILAYVFRDTANSVQTIWEYDINMKVRVEDKWSTSFHWEYKNIINSEMLYFHLPKFFKLGTITMDLENPSDIVRAYYEKVKKLTEAEESSEEISTIKSMIDTL